MVALTLDVTGVKELAKALEGTAKQLPRELSIAINATSKKVATGMSKQVREELVVKAKDVKQVLRVRKKAKATDLGATISLDHSRRLSLKAFGARQTRAGVSYRVSKREGRKVATSGFMGPRPGQKAARLNGHAFKRQGRSRKPIVKLHGASPWGVYLKRNMRPKTVVDGEKELSKQIDRRIRFNVLKKQGLI